AVRGAEQGEQPAEGGEGEGDAELVAQLLEASPGLDQEPAALGGVAAGEGEQAERDVTERGAVVVGVLLHEPDGLALVLFASGELAVEVGHGAAHSEGAGVM